MWGEIREVETAFVAFDLQTEDGEGKIRQTNVQLQIWPPASATGILGQDRAEYLCRIIRNSKSLTSL